MERNEAITVSYSLIHRVLTEVNIQSPKKRRRFKPHRRRARKAQEGLLIQMDASPFQWLGDHHLYALHGVIDDATGKILGLYMTKNECLQGYFETTRQILLSHGIPVSIYSDRHAIFLSTKKDKLTIEEQLAGKVCNDTQFGRAMKELGITIIHARSAQAKGRIERLWETLHPYTGYTTNAYGYLSTGRNWWQALFGNYLEVFTVEGEYASSVDLPFLFDTENSINIDSTKRAES